MRLAECYERLSNDLIHYLSYRADINQQPYNDQDCSANTNSNGPNTNSIAPTSSSSRLSEWVTEPRRESGH